MVMKVVINGEIAFWYDPARDLLLGLANLEKVTLIGPTSGIPGIFYGPYWIWMLSIGLLISKNPRVVDFFMLTLPYFTVFPFVLWQFSKIWGKGVVIILWLLFIFSFSHYSLQIWNPHLAPLFSLVFIYLLVFSDFKKSTFKNSLKIFFAGVFAALVLNFHISFGIGLVVGAYVFILIDAIQKMFWEKGKKQNLIKQYSIVFFCFSFGLAITFLPYVIFEYRHGFQQTKVLLQTLSSNTAVVGVKGLEQMDIFLYFSTKIGEVLHMPAILASGMFVLATGYILVLWKTNRIHISDREIKLVTLLTSILSLVMIIYLRSKNPVWGYHFINVEIIFLLFTGFLLSKSVWLQRIVGLWAGVVCVMAISSMIQTWNNDPYIVPSLKTKEYIVRIIGKDKKNQDFAVTSYNQSIYTYEYDYLFKWLLDKETAHQPQEVQEKDLVYLIIEKTNQEKRKSFIDYFTPSKSYTTKKIWNIPEGTTIIRRERISIQEQ